MFSIVTVTVRLFLCLLAWLCKKSCTDIGKILWMTGLGPRTNELHFGGYWCFWKYICVVEIFCHHCHVSRQIHDHLRWAYRFWLWWQYGHFLNHAGKFIKFKNYLADNIYWFHKKFCWNTDKYLMYVYYISTTFFPKWVEIWNMLIADIYILQITWKKVLIILPMNNTNNYTTFKAFS